jgi:hypothetical protein
MESKSSHLMADIELISILQTFKSSQDPKFEKKIPEQILTSSAVELIWCKSWLSLCCDVIKGSSEMTGISHLCPVHSGGQSQITYRDV